MGELLSSLGIDLRLFLAQLINFSILLFVLFKFAYKPILNMMDERTEKIEKGAAEPSKEIVGEIRPLPSPNTALQYFVVTCKEKKGIRKFYY